MVRLIGPVVKWLRHCPFTAGSRVRIPPGSPKFCLRPVDNIKRCNSASRAPLKNKRGMVLRANEYNERV